MIGKKGYTCIWNQVFNSIIERFFYQEFYSLISITKSWCRTAHQLLHINFLRYTENTPIASQKSGLWNNETAALLEKCVLNYRAFYWRVLCLNVNEIVHGAVRLLLLNYNTCSRFPRPHLLSFLFSDLHKIIKMLRATRVLAALGAVHCRSDEVARQGANLN